MKNIIPSWSEGFPLNTFHGETKEQLIYFIEGLITESIKGEKERITKILDGKGFVDYEDLE